MYKGHRYSFVKYFRYQVFLQKNNKFQYPLEGHTAGCAIAGCKCCSITSRKTRIFSSNYKSFPTPSYTNCSTQCVIYLLECTVCSQRNQYIGQTKRSVSKRISGHRAASRIKTSSPIYKHFDQPDHNFVNNICDNSAILIHD